MTINLLPEEIINQIAAGEVIENPSAVIKELVENSIDAKAKNIEIEIENSGLKRISIKDDGIGIRKEDLPKAPKRHATSKIKTFEDLYSIKTRGFRGEALASIFSIAKTRIISDSGDGAFEISSENLENPRKVAGKKGTSIHVEEIFYNTPARKKYLKNDNLELKAILEIMQRFEVIEKDIKFSLTHNGKTLINKPSFKTLKENIIFVLGREYKDNLFEINNESKGIKITGYLAKPSAISYPYIKNQFIFVNGRFIKSKLLKDAIYDGCSSNLMIGRHPSFVINIEIDPEIIDVNIHPTKIEVRFENEREIFSLLSKTIRDVFRTQESFKDFETPKEIQIPLIKEKDNKKSKKEEKSYFAKDFQKALEIRDGEIQTEKKEEIENIIEKEEDKKPGPLFEELNEYKILGQLNKTYIILETKNNLILVDQHVAEEKYYYELFIEKFERKKPSSQTLIKPYIITLTKTEKIMYEENKELLDTIGFETEIFGENEIIVRAVPISIRNKITEPEKARDYLYEILLNKKIRVLENEKYAKIASLACRTAVMAGDELTNIQMRKMIENLRFLKEPFNCPHGRPTFLRYPYRELDKKFKRIV